MKNRTNQEFKILISKLDIYCNSEHVFTTLFANEILAFWLDSSQVELGLSRFSFMGDGNGPNSLLVQYFTRDQKIVVTQSGQHTYLNESIFDYLDREIRRRNCPSPTLPFDFNTGFVGYFGYELKAECESELINDSPLPDSMFLLADRILAFDHQEKSIYLLCLVKNGEEDLACEWFRGIKQQLLNLPPLPPVMVGAFTEPIDFHLSRSYKRYINDITDCLNEIYEGESYEICLTNKVRTDIQLDPLNFYRNLRQINPAPYASYLRFNDVTIASSSPERFLKVDQSGWAESKPIKGTRPRGKSAEEDLILQQDLGNNVKDRAENLMIVDLLRNDLGRVCKIGTVHVPKLMNVETYSTVHQLVSTICGHIEPNTSVIQSIKKLFPGGSMTGAPKLRTMEIIDRLEGEARGVYSGSIGYLGFNGAIDMNIVIRTAVMTHEGISIGVGGGIIALSDPQLEFEETLIKAKALINAILITAYGEIMPDNYRFLNVPKDEMACLLH